MSVAVSLSSVLASDGASDVLEQDDCGAGLRRWTAALDCGPGLRRWTAALDCGPGGPSTGAVMQQHPPTQRHFPSKTTGGRARDITMAISPQGEGASDRLEAFALARLFCRPSN
mmetsp:Transcript_74000/g.216792  ORF Transcript_74000/g.216792 Transcript_74000/m.216792 type:complete len:114 (+) Transcript_74000:441-782(+)